MAARSGLADLITELRSLTQASTADFTLGTISFWDDDQMQLVLDRHRRDLNRELLTSIPTYEGGSVFFYEYRSELGHLEQTTGGTAVLIIEDGTGADQSSSLYTPDYTRGVFTFAADQGGTAYYLTARAYDLNGAAAEIWRQKAGHFANTHFDFSTDNMSVKRGQIVSHCHQMAMQFSARAWPQVTSLERSDLA